MPGFKIHISGSSFLGIGYGLTALAVYDVPLPTCLLATGLCSVSGMLPDLDSGPGIPLRESLCFSAAFVPMLLFDRARELGWTHESMVLAGALLYLLIRFGLGHFLRHHSIHRGIYHSIPVCLIFAGLAFLLCNTGELPVRYYKAGAVVIGFMSHLILDEIWSIERKGMVWHLKKSSGTAVKLWAPCWWSTTLAYVGLAAVTALVLSDPIWEGVSPRAKELHEIAADDIVDPTEKELDAVETDVETDVVAAEKKKERETVAGDGRQKARGSRQ
ncbi:MAG TPA: metal-dependent hydrolase [Pirellulales bacterium]|nr:metal-dependent hydrolase [Pirellulales bacterium]